MHSKYEHIFIISKNLSLSRKNNRFMALFNKKHMDRLTALVGNRLKNIRRF